MGAWHELDTIPERLEAARLLTLTGVGGCGKTRLAIEVARRVSERYRDGARLVELAQITDPGLVPHRLATVLGVQASPGQPLDRALADALAASDYLLVLDNCEHVLDACATLVDLLLASVQRSGYWLPAASQSASRAKSRCPWLRWQCRIPPCQARWQKSSARPPCVCSSIAHRPRSRRFHCMETLPTYPLISARAQGLVRDWTQNLLANADINGVSGQLHRQPHSRFSHRRELRLEDGEPSSPDPGD
jgi:hypothetical protein